MSASSKQCVWAAVCFAFTMCSAISLRTLLNGTTSSRGPAAGEAAGATDTNPGNGAAARGALAGAPVAAPTTAGAPPDVAARGAGWRDSGRPAPVTAPAQPGP